MTTIKHQLYLLVLIFAALLSCTKKPNTTKDGHYKISATIENLSDGTKILLRKQKDDTTITIDSTVALNGQFEFQGRIQTPAMFGIFIDGIRGGIFPLVEDGSINITAHSDNLKASTISGSKLNDELQQFKEGSQKIVSKINDLFPQIQKARFNNDLSKINEINNKMRAINNENTRYSLDYAKNNPNSFVSSVILQDLLRIPEVDINEVKNIYSNFSEDVKKSEYSKNIYRFLLSRTEAQKDSIN